MVEKNDLERANEDAREAWNANAAYWDERMGEGNDFHLELIWPPTERLLGLTEGMRVLDVGCGNGLSARRMAAAGASVLGIDIAEAMIERARAHQSPHMERIEYRVLDVTDEDALAGLGEQSFDAAVANMVLMDVADIRPLFRGSHASSCRARRSSSRSCTLRSTTQARRWSPSSTTLTATSARLTR